MLRRDKELDITDAQADLLMSMSPATIDRKLTDERKKMLPRGRSHTKPGSLLKSQIPIRTWAEWDDAVPGFVEIDLVGHEGGNASGEYCFTLTVTDISTGWTVNRSVKEQSREVGLRSPAARHRPSSPSRSSASIPTTGQSSSTNTSWPTAPSMRSRFTRSRSGNKNDGAHVEQKNSGPSPRTRRISPL